MQADGTAVARAVVLVLALLLALPIAGSVRAALTPSAAPGGAVSVTFDIQVDPGAADYMHNAAELAVANQQDLIIVMNTPGGLLDSMVQIVSDIQLVEAAGLGVYTWVPPGAMAASAGSYIALASDAVYMANASFIGPSTPYVIGAAPGETEHVVSAMVAYMENLASAHGYNVAAAVDMVENNTAYTGPRAASVHLVTGLAETYPDFLADVGVSSASLTSYGEPLFDQFLSFLSNPTVDGLFILVGVVALVLDLLHRTLFLTVAGVVLLALGFLGAEIIGASIVGILILIIAAALIFLELKAGHGLFALSGVALGLVGTWMLASGVQYSPSPYGLGTYILMGSVGAITILGFVYLLKIRATIMAQPKLIDAARVVGMTGRAVTDIGPGHDGVCNVGAEDWTSSSEVPIAKGTIVRVTSYTEGKVFVEPAAPSAEAPQPP